MARHIDRDELIRRFDLQPHPEGGFFRETYRSSDAIRREGSADSRSASTAIYYLLCDGAHSAWHRIQSDEVWHFYAGDPLELSLSVDGIVTERHVLGLDLAGGARMQIVVPAKVWQSAQPLGAYTLVGCTVAPGFEFDGFEMAPPGWTPKPR